MTERRSAAPHPVASRRARIASALARASMHGRAAVLPVASAIRRATAVLHAPARVRAAAAALVAATALLGSPGTLPPAHAQRAPVEDAALSRLLAEARDALQAGRGDDAYRRLAERIDAHAGTPAFDYLLGLAALDAGRPGVAVLALERVLAADPSHLQARAEIGRAYLALRELDAARRELREVARAELPPAVRDTVQRYLDTVARLDGRGPRWRGGVELGVGHDDNVNFGSSAGEWVLADGRSLVPLPSSRPRRSAFGSLGGDLAYVAPINGWLDWTVGLQFAQRTNPSQHNIDTGTAELSAGLAATRDAHRYSMSLQYQHLRLDGASFRDAAGAIAQWQWDAGPRTQLGAYAQAFDLAFPGEPVRDATRVAGGLTVAHGFGGALSPTLAAALHGGDERARADVPQLSFGFAGLRTALGLTLGAGWRANLGASFERRDFDGAEPLFGVARVDRQTDLRAGLEHDASRSLTIAPGIAWTRNASNVAPNDFRRTQVFVFARYRF